MFKHADRLCCDKKILLDAYSKNTMLSLTIVYQILSEQTTYCIGRFTIKSGELEIFEVN